MAKCPKMELTPQYIIYKIMSVYSKLSTRKHTEHFAPENLLFTMEEQKTELNHLPIIDLEKKENDLYTCPILLMTELNNNNACT
jgi:hypothetical protein